jgi:hypothetical protein
VRGVAHPVAPLRALAVNKVQLSRNCNMAIAQRARGNGEDLEMATYQARMLDAETNGEGHYVFEGPDGLMQKTADEIVGVFFDHVEREVLKRHADWEINAVMKNRDRGVVTAIGSLIPDKNDPPLPFLLLISNGAGAAE